MVQKRAGLDVNKNVLTLSFHTQAIECPDRRIGLTIGRPETRKIMFADKHLCRRVHGLRIEPHRNPPAAALFDAQRCPPVGYSIGV